jgi:plastocyanin
MVIPRLGLVEQFLRVMTQPKPISSELHFAIVFCETNWRTPWRKPLLTKLRGFAEFLGPWLAMSRVVSPNQRESNMQRAVHNRATIELAKTTDASARVTADEVNLDRFHNRIRKVCSLVAATLIPSSLRWMLLFTVLIVPQVLWGAASAPATPQPTPQTWFATVGAQSGDMGHQALAFLPNEIWIHAGDSITWRWDVGDIHTVTFLKDGATRPNFGVPPFSSSPATFDGSTSVITPPLVKPATFTVTFPSPGNFKQVCLVHERMTGAVHVLDLSQPLPHDQDFYDRQAADQRRDLLSDRDGRIEEACRQHGDQGEHHHHSIDAHLVTVGVGEISATAGGSQTLSVVRFIDDTIVIHAGQTVEWNNHDPVTAHTVTFGTEPANLGPPSSNVPGNITVDADGTLHATISSNADSVHSGLIVAPPQELIGQNFPLGVTRFRVTFTRAGTFPYICALHDNLGMKGTVFVFP